MATRKQVSDTVKQRFQYHRLWGTKSHDWNNHAPQGLYYAGTGDYSADHPEEGIASGHEHRPEYGRWHGSSIAPLKCGRL